MRLDGQKHNEFLENFIIGVSDGNPGCVKFILDAMASCIDSMRVQIAFTRMKMYGITGAKLYMLWNDCCDRNTEKALEICLAESISAIEEHINYTMGRGIPWQYDISGKSE